MPLTRRQQPGEPSDRRAGLAARQLGHVGVELLRHHRRAGRGARREAHEAELRRRPEAELLADPREVREEDGRSVEVVERRSPDRLRRRASCASSPRREEPGGRVSNRRALRRRAGSARAASAAKRKRARIALEHLDPGEQVVADRHRLRALQVRVAGHQRLRLASAEVERRAASVSIAGDRLAARVARRRGGTRSRPGRCASGRRGSCGRPPERARSPCGRPRLPSRPRRLLRIRASPVSRLARAPSRSGDRRRGGAVRGRASPSQS